ncbi:MAG: conserved exported protein of unknown function [Nitrosopumilales archaeon]|nr:MAG: conserved exported protein of unknown function [Nitrosopumilales archaeon]
MNRKIIFLIGTILIISLFVPTASAQSIESTFQQAGEAIEQITESISQIPLPLGTTRVEEFTVSPGEVRILTINLKSGDRVGGSFAISGGNNDVNFWVADPAGRFIISKQGVTGGKDFSFTASREGLHHINYDNSFSIITSKYVSLSYTVERAGGGCLIATATYGSELALQVQKLREIRDNTLLQTDSGSAFMAGFNEFYYSFSPTIADWERQNPMFKEAVKITITPLLTSLSILNYVDIDSEPEMLGYGIGIIMMNVGMYIAIPTLAILGVKKFL